MELLAKEETNLVQLLDKNFVNTVIKFTSLAHINPDQIGNILARATANTLLIKDVSNNNNNNNNNNSNNVNNENGQNENVELNNKNAFQQQQTQSTTTANATGDDEILTEEEELNKTLKRSMWVPDDVACPKVWFAAPKSQNFPPPKSVQKGF
jgi:hypothetical protein